jgi:hypothetical protein
MRAVSLIVAGEHCLISVEEASRLIGLLRRLENPYSPDFETAAMTAAVVLEEAAKVSPIGNQTLTDEEERTMLTVLNHEARSAALSARLGHLRDALERSHE